MTPMIHMKGLFISLLKQVSFNTYFCLGDMELKRYLMAKTIITIDEAYNQFMKKYHQIISTCI